MVRWSWQLHWNIRENHLKSNLSLRGPCFFEGRIRIRTQFFFLMVGFGSIFQGQIWTLIRNPSFKSRENAMGLDIQTVLKIVGFMPSLVGKLYQRETLFVRVMLVKLVVVYWLVLQACRTSQVSTRAPCQNNLIVCRGRSKCIIQIIIFIAMNILHRNIISIPGANCVDRRAVCTLRYRGQRVHWILIARTANAAWEGIRVLGPVQSQFIYRNTNSTQGTYIRW